MAGNEVHIIRKQTFKLKLANGKDPLALEKHIQEIFRKRVVAQLAELFSSLGPPDLVIRIDKLVIKLGVIQADTLADFEKEFSARIQSQVKLVVQKILAKKEVQGINLSRNLSQKEEDLELFAIFLKTGRLPWWTSKEVNSIGNLLRNLLKKHPRPLLESVSTQIRQKPQLERLIRQFPQQALKELLLLKLEKSEWKALKPYLTIPARSPKTDTQREFVASETYQNWEQTFRFVFSSDQPYKRKKLLQQLTIPSHLAPNMGAQATSQPTPQQAEGEPAPGQPGAKDPQDPQSREEKEADSMMPISAPAIREVLIHFLIHGSLPRQFDTLAGEQLESFFEELVDHSPQQLFEVMEDIIAHPFAVERLQYQFSPELILSILATLSDQPLRFWKNTIQLLRKGLPSQINGQPAKRFVEHFCLIYSTTAYRESFDIQGLIEAFFHHLSKNTTVEVEPILEKWQQQQKKKNPVWFQEALLAFDQKRGKQTRHGKPVEEMVSEAMAYLQGNKISQNQAKTLLTQLVKKAPLKLVDSLRESILTPQILYRLGGTLAPRELFTLIEKSTPALQGKVEEIQETLISFLAHQKTSLSSAQAEKWLFQVFLAGALHQASPQHPEGWSLLLIRSLTSRLAISQEEVVASFETWMDTRSTPPPRVLRMWLAIEDVLTIERISQEEEDVVMNELPFELIVEEEDVEEFAKSKELERSQKSEESGKSEELGESGESGESEELGEVDKQQYKGRVEKTRDQQTEKKHSDQQISAEQNDEIKTSDEASELKDSETPGRIFQLSDLKTSKKGSASDKEMVGALMEVLLKRGRLEGTRKKPEAIFHMLLERDARISREVMSSFMENPLVRTRIVSWLDAPSWKKLIAISATTSQSEVQQLTKDLTVVLKNELVRNDKEKTFVVKQAEVNKLERLIEEARLMSLLQKSPFTVQQVLERIIAMWASNLGIAQAKFLFELRKATETQREKIGINLAVLLGRMAKRNRKHRLPKSEERRRKKGKKEAPEDPMLEGVTVMNGGAVILAPFLPRYFKILGLRQEGAFVDDAAHERAIHLLQYLITGKTDSEEHELMLNKVLCGFPLENPISRGIDIKENEKAISEQLLKGVIQNWATIKRSSIETLRETFLQREGILAGKEDMWMLKIEQGPFDMILDTLPWSISMVKLSWMEKILQVEWR